VSRPRKVQVVTTARRSVADDISARQRHYIYAMTIRTASLILAIFVLHGPVRFVALFAGMVLPFFSVTTANAGPLPNTGDAPELIAPDERPALPPGGPTIDMEGP
jgi:hypothetical protein